MDLFAETISIARKELASQSKPSVNSKDDSNPVVFEKNQRRLLNVAWKIYDLTSEMAYLKADVDSLTGKVDAIDMGSGEESDVTYMRKLVSELAIDTSFEEEEGKLRIKNGDEEEQRAREEVTENGEKQKSTVSTVKINGKKLEFPEMDDLSFSIFKDVVQEIATECVGKMLAKEDERNSRVSSLSRERSKEPENSFQCKASYDFSKDYKMDREAFTRPTGIRWDDLEFPEDIAERYQVPKSTFSTSKPSFSTTTSRSHQREQDRPLYDIYDRKVRFTEPEHRESRFSMDSVFPEDATFSSLNDSLYFHRSRVNPPRKRSSSKFERRHSDYVPLKLPSPLSSDGSDIY